MQKTLALPALLAICSVPSLLAQTKDATPDDKVPVSILVEPLDGEATKVAQAIAPDASSSPFLLNIFTVIGANSSGVPCYNCVTNAGTPNVGIVVPAGYVIAGGAAPQIDIALYDFNYTGSCTVTIEVIDKTKTVVASTAPTFSFTSSSSIFVEAVMSIPSTAAVGVGVVESTVLCGTSSSKSGSAVVIY